MKCLIFIAVLSVSMIGCKAQIDGNWGDWSAWSTCSVTCLSGQTTRERLCDNPPPSNGGLNCSGDAAENLSCVIMNYCLPSQTGNQDLSCGSGYFGCATGIVTCLNISLRCDDEIHCEDGSDENPYFTGCPEKYCSAAFQISPSFGTLVLLLLAVVQWINPWK